MNEHTDQESFKDSDVPNCPPQNVMKIAKGELDPLGDRIHRVLVSTDKFVIYSIFLDPTTISKPSASQSGDSAALPDASGSDGHSWLRTYYPQGYDCAKDLRAKLGHISEELHTVCNVVESICLAKSLDDSSSHSLRSRASEMMARTMEMTFEDHGEKAKTLLTKLISEVTTLRDSKNRMRYVTANVLTLFLLIAMWAALRYSGALDASLIITRVENDTTFPVAHALDVLALGALGSFFAVSAAIQSIRVNHSVSWPEMIYSGAVRVPIGVIAATLTTFLISGGWLLGSIDGQLLVWSLYLFGFIAGFSELFVPNALKQVEASATVSAPGQDGV